MPYEVTFSLPHTDRKRMSRRAAKLGRRCQTSTGGETLLRAVGFGRFEVILDKGTYHIEHRLMGGEAERPRV